VKMFLLVILTLVGTATLTQFIRLARFPFRLAFWAVLVLFYFSLQGCATLPMPLQPKNEQYNSNMAEGAWLVLDGIDTLQTMHLKRDRDPTTTVTCNREADPLAAKIYGGQYPSPSRVLLTNLALATVHTMVTSWLDDEVAKHDQANDGSVGPWYVGRVVWHAASIAFSLHSVINNAKQGCKL
jgi:hypothetical protein